MTDLKYLLELILILAIPVAPVAIGAYLRARFPVTPDAARPQKMWRLAGNILLWGGLAVALFMVLMALHFKGKFM